MITFILYQSQLEILQKSSNNIKHPHLQFRDYETLTPCGHSEACRSSSRWRDQPRPGSQNGQRRTPWSRFRHIPPGVQGHAHRHDYE